MNIYLDTDTSLLLLRSVAANSALALRPTDERRPRTPELRPVKLARLNIPELLSFLRVPEERPLGIVVPSAKDRVRASGITCTVDAMHREGSSFFELCSSCEDKPSGIVPKHAHVFVQSPASIVLGMAKRLRRKELAGQLSSVQATLLLVKLCLELCGTYTHDPFCPNSGEVIYHVAPRLTRNGLLAFLQGEGAEQGITLARQAAELAYDLSGSPQETFLGPALFYPTRLGGLSLCRFEANQPLDLSPREREAIGFRTITPDFQLPDYNSAIEFMGLVHLSGNNPAIDHRRSLDYQTLGKREFSFWYEDVRDLDSFMKSAQRIVSVIEQFDGPAASTRFRRLAQDASFRAKQAVLFRVFRPWLRGKGMLEGPMSYARVSNSSP